MARMENIVKRLAPELEAMNGIIADSLHTPNRMMNDIVDHYLEVKGKQIRPMLVILAAKMFGRVSDEVLYAGASLEMLHNASLIHDDIVDETFLRRGRDTINASWGNHIAVLVGDYFVSNALSVGLRSGSVKVVSALCALGQELSLGEIDQITTAREHSFDTDSYFTVIRQKTASLFCSCVNVGLDVSHAPEQYVAPMGRYAELLGLCFQIKDDIFDYFPNPQIGKPTGNDLREGKVTLPLLYALQNAPGEESDRMKDLIRRGDLTAAEIESLVEFAKEHGGIDDAFTEMRRMQKEADEIIAPLPDSESKESFREIFDYIISRDH